MEIISKITIVEEIYKTTSLVYGPFPRNTVFMGNIGIYKGPFLVTHNYSVGCLEHPNVTWENNSKLSWENFEVVSLEIHVLRLH